ncbi:MAG: YkgJ family cysteine cluster protein, partial [Gammaproteobacteria bacterium]|nr:YkgJ family cysteine cluster protein [Gammaproteobacteria bacterium]NIR95377.1 YkgJ family cysteine cluster protein [Gammaproteobacteria bacterium]
LKDYLRRHRSEIGPCPFLDSQDFCSIYSSRPLSCRALLSTRPAEWCRIDFSELDHWDKQAFESSLDRKVVAWPSHYVAATQDYAREMETQLMVEMQQQQGWALSGNFAVMTWLEVNCQLNEANLTREQVQQVLTENQLDNNLILSFF